MVCKSYPLWLCVICVVMVVSWPARADRAAMTVDVRASTDGLYHGLSETDKEPQLGVNLDYQLNGTWFVGTTLNVAHSPQETQRHQNADAYVGFELPVIRDSWRLSASARYRSFIESDKRWDYVSTDIRLSRGALAFALEYAPDYYDHDTSAMVATGDYLRRFGRQQYWRMRAGINVLDGRDNYLFGSVALGWSHRALGIELSYDWHDLDAPSRFGDPVQDPTFNLGVTYRCW